MDFKSLQDAVLADRFGETRRETAKRVLNAQIARMWSAQPWGFKRRAAVSVTVPADDEDGLYDIEAPEIVEEFLGCYDENGDPLEAMPNDRFEDLYESETETGTPEAFTLYGSDANMQIRFGPAPETDRIYRLPYNAGPPTLENDEDDLAAYGWPGQHHEVIVAAARIHMLRDENDPTWRELEPTRKEFYDSMVDALVEDRGGTTGEFGRDQFGVD